METFSLLLFSFDVGFVRTMRIEVVRSYFIFILLFTGVHNFWDIYPEVKDSHCTFSVRQHLFKHCEPQIWPKIKHHLSTALNLGITFTFSLTVFNPIQHEGGPYGPHIAG